MKEFSKNPNHHQPMVCVLMLIWWSYEFSDCFTVCSGMRQNKQKMCMKKKKKAGTKQLFISHIIRLDRDSIRIAVTFSSLHACMRACERVCCWGGFVELLSRMRKLSLKVFQHFHHSFSACVPAKPDNLIQYWTNKKREGKDRKKEGQNRDKETKRKRERKITIS